MTNFGTGFVTMKADWSNFDRDVSRHLSGQFQGAGDDAGRDFARSFDKRTSGLFVPLAKDASDTFTKTFSDRVKLKVDTPIVAPLKLPDAPELNIPTPKIPAPELPRELTEEMRIDLKIEGVDAEIAKVNAKLTALRAQPNTVEVRVETAQALIALERLEQKKERLTAERETIKVDVDESLPSTLNRISSSVQGLFTSLGGGGGGGLAGATARVSAGFINFGVALGPLLAILAAVAAVIAVSLVAALAALASSLAVAAAGAGALAVALAGVAGPALALGVLVGTRLAKVFEALKAQDAAADDIGRKTMEGAQAASAAIAQQETAARGLQDAQRQLGEASKQAFREMADAAEAASDAIRGVEAAQVSLDRAQLSTERAELELQKFREELNATAEAFGDVFQKFTDVSVDTSGLRKAIAEANSASGNVLTQEQELDLRDKILAVREARLREKEAIDSVSDAQRAATRAQQVDNEFKAKGIAASKQYQAALRGVEAATLAVAQAQDQQGFSTSQAKAIQLTDKLTKSEQALLAAIKRIRDELRGSFQPATDAAFGGMLRALLRVPNLINPLRASFTRLGEAVGAAFDTFSLDLIKPKTLANLRALVDGMAELTGPITRGLSSLFQIFLNIATAALPFLVEDTKKVADQLGEWADATSDTAKLSKTIGGLVDHLHTWLDVGAAIGDVFLAFIGTAAKPGKDLAESIKSVAEETARWLREAENQEKVREFFEDVIPLAKEFVVSVAQFVAQAVEFTNKVAPALTKVLELFNAIVSVTDKLNTAPVGIGLPVDPEVLRDSIEDPIKDARDAVGGFAASIASSVGEALEGLPDRARRAGIAIITSLAAGAGSAPQGVANALRNAVALGFAEVGKFFTPMLDRGRRLVFAIRDGITQEAGKVTDAVRGAIVDAIAAIRGLLGRVGAAGRSIGRGIADGIKTGLGALEGIGTTVLNALVRILNRAIGLINDATPGKINLPGPLPDIPAIPDIPPVRLQRGGTVPGSGFGDKIPALLEPFEFVVRRKIVEMFGPTVFADINTGRLDPRVGYQEGDRPRLRAVPVRSGAMALGGMAGASAATTERGRTIVHASFPITVPGGHEPDPVVLGVKASQVIENRFGGDPRQV